MDVALPENNLFVINLWWAGAWRRVVVDGCLPVDSFGRTVFASCEDHSRCSKHLRPLHALLLLLLVVTCVFRSYWAALVEKAAAKLRGSYAKMDAISMRDSMTMLAGAACVSYNSADDAAFVDFELCDKWQRRGALFLASRQGEGNANGIHCNHAYSVLQVSD
jgi:hypothetical protein